ncbi:hypothetical protein BGW80DRAFT_1558268 [Lactifluus volemus]|nr:hypothetical protein BGW80DRAFT_1558268 [Lactifluus volemus]
MSIENLSEGRQAISQRPSNTVYQPIRLSALGRESEDRKHPTVTSAMTAVDVGISVNVTLASPSHLDINIKKQALDEPSRSLSARASTYADGIGRQ